MANRFALAKTPMYDAAGNLNRSWHLFFSGLTSTGAGGAGASSYVALNPSGSSVDIALASGANTCVQLTLNGTAFTIHAPTVNSGNPTAGDKFSLYLDQDATGNRPFPTFDTGSGNYAADVNNQAPILTASTRTAMVFTFHGDVWALDSFRTNGSLS